MKSASQTSGALDVPDHGSVSGLQVFPVTGLPEFRPGDDVAEQIAHQAPWLVDDDIVDNEQDRVQGRGTNRRCADRS